MKRKRTIYLILLFVVVFVVSAMCFSYAFFSSINEEHGKLNIVAGTLDYKLESSDLVNNQITIPANTTKEITIKITSLNEITSKYELYYNVNSSDVDIGYSTDTKDSVKGTINKNETKDVKVSLRNNTDSSQSVTFGVQGGLEKYELELTKGNSLLEFKVYAEVLLNGADPVLSDNLVPIEILDDGTVTKANLYNKWYSYEDKVWANAVVLRNSDTYAVGDEIEEADIQSYFVWIPKYSYQLWDLGDYSSLTTIDSTKPHAIPIRFGLTNTNDSVTGECTTPGVASEKGNCKVGDYMTHPAFLAFDSNGMWVGKFETGYDGASSTEEAQTDVDKVDTSKIIIKPNAYSWRNIKLSNMFENSYQYLKNDNSHMVKNTEWGAIAYLSHSLYGTCEEINGTVTCNEIRVNNNSAYITGYASTEQPTVGYNNGTSIEGNRLDGTAIATDGTYTVNYLNSSSNIASTTGNYTGIYDVSGGTWEYTMGYNTGASTVGASSEITTLYEDFYTNPSWDKYYDKYSATASLNYNNRILGDATGEMGPFANEEDPDGTARSKSSWYGDYTNFVNSSNPWFVRGGNYYTGSTTGIFASSRYSGNNFNYCSYRIVLTPTK